MWEKNKEKILRILSCKSLKARIFLIIVIVGMLPSIWIQSAILSNYEDRAVSVRTNEINNQLLVIANHLVLYNYLQDPSSDIINAELEQISNLYDGRVLIINRNFNVIKDTYGLSVGKTIIGNSNDVFASEEQTGTGISVSVNAEDGEGFSSAYAYDLSHSKELEIERIVQESTDLAKNSRNGQPTETRTTNVVLDYFAISSLGQNPVEGRLQGVIQPMRVDEPFLWLLYKLGYIESEKVN